MPKFEGKRKEVGKLLESTKRNQEMPRSNSSLQEQYIKQISTSAIQNQQGRDLVREHPAPRGTLGHGTLVEGGAQEAG